MRIYAGIDNSWETYFSSNKSNCEANAKPESIRAISISKQTMDQLTDNTIFSIEQAREAVWNILAEVYMAEKRYK